MDLTEQEILEINRMDSRLYSNNETVGRDGYTLVEQKKSCRSDITHPASNLLQTQNQPLKRGLESFEPEEKGLCGMQNSPKKVKTCDELESEVQTDFINDLKTIMSSSVDDEKCELNSDMNTCDNIENVGDKTQIQTDDNFAKMQDSFTSRTLENETENLINITSFDSQSSESEARISFVFSDIVPSLTGFCITSFKDSCTKGCSWSPSGDRLLVAAEDARYRIFDVDVGQSSSEMRESVVIKETEMLYDWRWCHQDKVLSTGRYQPIHLWDAKTGQLLDSYKCFNHVDEITSAFSLCPLDTAGNTDSFVVGLRNEIRMFAFSRPGRENQNIIRNKSKDPDKIGIVSCLAYSHEKSLLAAGSYNKTVGIYYLNGGCKIYSLGGHHGGITQVKFSADGNRLYTGARKDNQILVWDTRYLTQPLTDLHREVSTNQRIEFDLVPSSDSDKCGQQIVSGGTDGVVRVWDSDGNIVSGYLLHPDAVPGCSVHPGGLPLLATCSGQRHARGANLMEDEPDAMSENSVKLWNFNHR